MYTIVNYRPESFTLLLTQLCKNSNRFSSKLGLCLGWKGQLICLEGEGRGGGDGGEGGGRGGMDDCYTYSNRYVQ